MHYGIRDVFQELLPEIQQLPEQPDETLAELDSPLVPLVKIPPVYPLRAIRRGIEGVVDVEFIITKKGRIEQPKIIKALPEKIFDQSVLNCVSRWKFKPGTVEGIPVNTRASTTIRFKLEK